MFKIYHWLNLLWIITFYSDIVKPQVASFFLVSELNFIALDLINCRTKVV